MITSLADGGDNSGADHSDERSAETVAEAGGKQRLVASGVVSLDNLHADVARLSVDLNRATVLEAEKDEEILCLKATPPEFASFFRGHAGFERGLSMHQTKDEFVVVLKKMAYFVPGAQGRLTEAPLSVILQLDPEKLAHPVNFLALRDARVSPHIVKESTVTPAFESSEFPPNVFPTSSVIALEQNEEWMNVIVDWSDPEMTNGATHAKSVNSFMQGTSYVLDDVAKVIVVGSKCVSSGPGNVVMALSIGEKVDGLLPSSAADEEATSNPFGV
nr:hypothetical protein [Tanacetum cinerariifolium]